MHPAIGTGEMRRWIAGVPTDTPPLSVRSAYALSRLYRLEGYSAENTVLLTSSVCTAKKLGWDRVCDLVGVPADESQWPAYRFEGQASVSKYFEDMLDALTRPFLDTEEQNARCASVYDKQCRDHEGFDLEQVLAVAGWPNPFPLETGTPRITKCS